MVQQYEKKIKRIFDGSKKEDVCRWWLGFIEEQADEFLEKQVYISICLYSDVDAHRKLIRGSI